MLRFHKTVQASSLILSSRNDRYVGMMRGCEVLQNVECLAKFQGTVLCKSVLDHNLAECPDRISIRDVRNFLRYSGAVSILDSSADCTSTAMITSSEPESGREMIAEPWTIMGRSTPESIGNGPSLQGRLPSCRLKLRPLARLVIADTVSGLLDQRNFLATCP